MCPSDPAHLTFPDSQNDAGEKNAPFLSLDQYERILGNISEGIILLDSTWRIIYVNKQIAGVSSILPADVLGLKLSETPASLFDRELSDKIYSLSLQDKTASFEYYHPVLKRWYAYKVSPSIEGFLIVQSEINRNRSTSPENEAKPSSVTLQGASKIEENEPREQVREASPEELLASRTSRIPDPQPYGNLVALNTTRKVLDAIGTDMLQKLSSEYLDLLESSATVYEKDGSYAMDVFASGWCRFMDQASRKLCGTDDNQEALASGRWHCHESCWNVSRKSMETKQPVDEECAGGIRFYAVPILADGEVVGSMNFGYGDPPTDEARLQDLAERYQVTVDELRKHAKSYQPRPQWIIEIARQRLRTTAKLLGEIIQRRQIETNLRNSEARYRSITDDVLDHSHVGTFIIDRNSRVVWINKAMERFFGLQREHVIGQNKRLLIQEKIQHIFEDPASFSEKVIATYDDNSYVENFECHVLPGDGREERWLEHWSQPISTGLYAGGRLEYYTDITARKRAEKALQQINDMLEDRVAERTATIEQRNRELQSFAFAASHDLQEPLRKIQTFANLLHEEYGDRLDENARFYLGRIEQAGSRMSQLLTDLLAFSRIDTRLKSYEQTNVSAVVQEVLSDLDIAIKQGKMEVKVDVTGSIEADRNQIRQVLNHLVLNAIKFRRKDQNSILRITASVERSQREASFYLIEVEDNGIGFDQKYASRIFEPFERLHNKAQYPGTGMGLAICRRIVEQHNGTITAESKPGEGTRFIIRLPLNQKSTPTS